MGGAAEREHLDDPALGQGARDLAGPGPLPPGPDGELGRGVGLRRHRAQPAYDPGDRLGADRVESCRRMRQASARDQLIDIVAGYPDPLDRPAAAVRWRRFCGGRAPEPSSVTSWAVEYREQGDRHAAAVVLVGTTGHVAVPAVDETTT